MKKWIDEKDDEQEAHTLISLGVTACQAKILIFLSKTGGSSAQAISKATGINRTDIYRIMPTLYKEGLINKIISAPVKFEAVPIKDIITILMKHKTAEMIALKSATDKMIRDYKTNKNPVVYSVDEDQDRFILIPKGKAVSKKRKQAIEKAKESIDSACTYSNYIYNITDNYTRIMDALNRGVQIRHIIEMPNIPRSFPKEAQKIWGHPYFQIRAVAKPLTSIFEIYDNKEVIISVSAHKVYRSNIFCCNNTSILEITKTYFENTWTNASYPNEIINKMTITQKISGKKKPNSTESAIFV
ncbi:MAG: hypothetical protein NWF01_03770 [Candidatus Bathyarchaeota archaeon]|nr:hypothetical protein [Candidatus Bathyarchaeota archaeon]